MKSVIVGTAGHIDHGKTALVKALTGMDADRLEEEKRRGITIDIGFAHLEIPTADGSAIRLGFVDVPGHEKFVRNMLAGIGGIDLVLLVIAADEGVKPQTREHFDICRLLSIQRGITVLTKSDSVDRETLDVVRMEVEEFLRGSFLDVAKAPILAVSALTRSGIEELKRALLDLASQIPARDSGAIARLPIDRVFTMKGFGTVVTGTLISGSISRDDELELFPSGRKVRVRGIQVHGTAADQAVAGQRTALNLAGASTADLARGMSLALPDTFHGGKRVDVSLTLLPSAKPLKDRARVHLHVYTAEVIAEVRLYGGKEVKPGERVFAQLRMAEPGLLLPGDRFIIRQFSPVITIGGGWVLDANPPNKVKKHEAETFLREIAIATPEAALEARVARRGQQALSVSEAVAETGLPASVIQRYLSKAVQNGDIVRAADVFIHRGSFDSLKSQLTKRVQDFQANSPLVAGLSR
ncbi:MAG: selenocysteine-specific translation elongation factor, partial [Acidobacteriota bacterium]